MAPRVYRNKADECHRRGIEASTPTIKAEWDELSIEWHLLALYLETERPLGGVV